MKILDKYKYNPEDIVGGDQKSQHLTYRGQNIAYNILKGHVKQPVFIKVILKENVQDFDNFFQGEFEKFTQLQNNGVIKLLDRIETDAHGYLVFSKNEKPSAGNISLSNICIGIAIVVFGIFSFLQVSPNDTKKESNVCKYIL